MNLHLILIIAMLVMDERVLSGSRKALHRGQFTPHIHVKTMQPLLDLSSRCIKDALTGLSLAEDG
jgi:hypothetical protein